MSQMSDVEVCHPSLTRTHEPAILSATEATVAAVSDAEVASAHSLIIIGQIDTRGYYALSVTPICQFLK